MTKRLDYGAIAPEGMKAFYGVSGYLAKCGLPKQLVDLVYLRVSQLNGCAYCIDMHTKDARAEGETEQRIYAVPVWRETPFFTPRERAVLAFTEAVTEIGRDGVPDDVYAEARAHFEEAELVRLTVAIAAINVWNRLQIATRALPEVEGAKQAA